MDVIYTKAESYSMSNRSYLRLFYVRTRVVKVILFTGMVSSMTCPVSAWVIGYATTATYSDAHQSDVIIHTTSDDLPSRVPLNNTDEVKPSGVDTERDRLPPTTQELPSTHLESRPSGDEPPLKPRNQGSDLLMP
jgi:hypothetical protein